jgi:two-component system, NarL family, response regulator DevR
VHVLVVDDSDAVRERLLDLFADAHVELHEARDAERAIELLDSVAIDVIVLDVRLGAQSGLDLIREIRARQPGIVLVVLTNEVSEAHRRECLHRGADFFLDKSRQFEHAASVVARARR